MYRPTAISIGATLEARDALLLAGLKRAAALVGIAEVPRGDADLALRSPGTGNRHPELDVVCGNNTLVITLTRQPLMESWQALFELIGQLTTGIEENVPNDRHGLRNTWSSAPDQRSTMRSPLDRTPTRRASGSSRI